MSVYYINIRFTCLPFCFCFILVGFIAYLRKRDVMVDVVVCCSVRSWFCC